MYGDQCIYPIAHGMIFIVISKLIVLGEKVITILLSVFSPPFV